MHNQSQTRNLLLTLTIDTNPTSKPAAEGGIQLHVVIRPTYPEIFMRVNDIVPLLLLSVVVVTLPSERKDQSLAMSVNK